MDGFFACPECGSSVEVAGKAPGRQVRCGFCHRLVEVPYLPRIPAAGWRRRRFGGWKWVRWAWGAVAVVLVVGTIVTGVRRVRDLYRAVQDDSIRKMLDSSRSLEAEGQLGPALVDLDAALELIRRAGESAGFELESERRHRADLAGRDARAALDRLVRDEGAGDPLGEWLNLRARAQKDEDLAALRPAIEQGFRESVCRRGTMELEAARRDADSGRVVAAVRACDRIAALLRYLPPSAAAGLRAPAEALVERLVEARGVTLEAARGDFVLGSFESYRSHLMPALIKAMEARGFLPYREESPWKSAWRKAAYHMRLEVSERYEGNYFSTENRLTRIGAQLTLSSPRREVWRVTPTARTTVPLPGLSAYHSRRLAVSRDRSEELERLLYEDARGQIDARFGQALTNMPGCCP